MHLCDLLSFLIILVSLTHQIMSQESPQGTCKVWADPHLVMFPIDPAQQGLRMSYWCRSPGRMLVLKNKFIEVYVNVTEEPYWNEDFEIKLLAGPQTLCTITHNQRSCNSIFLDVLQIDSGLDILYNEADYLGITVNSYQINNHSVYDISITQSYNMTLESSGLCINKPPSCRLENSLNLFGGRRKRNLDRTNATLICDGYMKEAYKTAKELTGNTGSSMSEHARAACINDVSLSGDPSWGQSAIGFVVMDALKETPLKTVERRETLKNMTSSIAKAASRAKENSYQWIRSPPTPIILT